MPTAALDPRSRMWALATVGACLLALLLRLPDPTAAAIGIAALAVAALSWRQPLHAVWRLLLTLALIATVLLQAQFAFGRDTGCALLAAMLAVKPAETASLRDARSLVGFALFAPFATFLLDQGPLSLLLGLLAATLGLGALQRLADLESGDPALAGVGRRLLSVGRLLALGLPLALAAFWLFPRLASPMWGVPDRAHARPGLSDSMSPGQWQDLLTDDSPALRARFFGATPAPSQMYWRGYVLSDFDGREWTRARWSMALPPAQWEPGEPLWDYEVSIEPTDRRLLVALDLPRAAPSGTRLSHGRSLETTTPLRAVTRWRLQSSPPRRFEAQLHPLLRRQTLALPAGYNPRTLSLARRWRAAAGNDDAAIVRRALDWITAEFAYTLTTPLPGRHAVDEFLFDYQAGYCEHFSSAFTVLMRAAGIPARVVTGYAGGYRNPLGDYWLVRRSDAHAWAEVWLDGRGWVRVDPTAAVAPERIYDTLADRAGGDGALLDGFAGGGTWLNVTDWLHRNWNDLVLGFDADRQRRLLSPFGIDDLQPQRLAWLFALAALAALGWMLWLSRRGQRQPDPLLRAWHALGRRYARVGLGREPWETAGDWAERVSLLTGQRDDALRGLSRRFSEWRYAGPGHRGAAARSRRELGELVRALRAHRPPRHPLRR